MLQNLTIEKQRGVIQFLTAEGVKQASICCRLVTVNDYDSVSEKSVKKWSSIFVQAAKVWLVTRH